MPLCLQTLAAALSREDFLSAAGVLLYMVIGAIIGFRWAANRPDNLIQRNITTIVVFAWPLFLLARALVHQLRAVAQENAAATPPPTTPTAPLSPKPHDSHTPPT